MSREYKNTLEIFEEKGGPGRREELCEMASQNSDIQLETLLLEDYDVAFKDWVENELEITFEKENLPTVALFANQRFSEYMQSWKHTDDKKNFYMNFKVITRESNPKPGTMYGDVRNVPENKFYLMKREETIDKNGRPVFLDYKMRQPFCVDISYKVSVVTNKYRLINQFNEMINDKFKAINIPLNVKGNYVTMILKDISDESDYQIDDRQYYSQSFSITVRGYLIREEDYKIIESPKIKFGFIENKLYNSNKSWAEIEEIGENPDYQEMIVTINLSGCSRKYSFTIDEDFIVTEFKTNNLVKFNLNKNNEKVLEFNRLSNGEKIDIRFNNGDRVTLENAYRNKYPDEDATLELIGYCPHKLG